MSNIIDYKYLLKFINYINDDILWFINRIKITSSATPKCNPTSIKLYYYRIDEYVILLFCNSTIDY